MKRILSFSIFGDDPKYQKGALENVPLCRRFYPGWIVRFYVSQEMPPTLLRQLTDLGAEVIVKNRTAKGDGLFWRFLPANDRDLDALIVRDTDSRVGEREASAVEEWLRSGKGFHVMRDHPYHTWPIMGGTWGCRGHVLPSIRGLLLRWRLKKMTVGRGIYEMSGADQVFLYEMVYPLIKDNVLIHSEVTRFEGENVGPFPTERRDGDYVGRIYSEDGMTRAEQDEVIKTAKMNTYPFPAPAANPLKSRLGMLAHFLRA